MFFDKHRLARCDAFDPFAGAVDIQRHPKSKVRHYAFDATATETGSPGSHTIQATAAKTNASAAGKACGAAAAKTCSGGNKTPGVGEARSETSAGGGKRKATAAGEEYSSHCRTRAVGAGSA